MRLGDTPVPIPNTMVKVDQVTHKNDLRVRGEFFEQFIEAFKASLQVADDIERTFVG